MPCASPIFTNCRATRSSRSAARLRFDDCYGLVGSTAMIGWRARLGFLVPPGNPTVETEMIELAPAGVTVHFHRMIARGNPGALDGQAERNREMAENLDGSV